MSSKQSLINHLATLMDRHRALDKKVVDDYEKYVDSYWNRFTVRLKETLFYNVSLFQR